jgi:hypothetical protein
MKNIENVLREYVRRLPEEDVRHLGSLFSQSLGGDKAELADLLSKERSIDNWLTSADGSKEWFDMVALVGEFVKKEVARRHGDRKSRKAAEKASEKASEKSENS